MGVPESMLELLSEVMPPEKAREMLLHVAREVTAATRISALRAEQTSGPRVRCATAFETRFGPSFSDVSDLLEDMEPSMLCAAEDLILISPDKKTVRRSLYLLRDACAGGQLVGRRRMVRSLLERRFGRLHDVHESAIAVADWDSLNVCIDKLLTANHPAEVVVHLLRKLGVPEDIDKKLGA